MAAKRSRAPAVERAQQEQPGFVLTPQTIKWLIGVFATLVGAYVGWKVVWADIDSHWRQEAIQKAVDEKVAADIKAVGVKATADMVEHKKNETRSNAWQTWYIQDFRAAVQTQWYKQCLKDTKGKGDCSDLESQAADAKVQANQTKAAASDLSKEKP